MNASSARRLRVADLGFHESNNFAPVPATLERFLAGGWTEGDDIVGRHGTSQATLAGHCDAGPRPLTVERQRHTSDLARRACVRDEQLPPSAILGEPVQLRISVRDAT
jgi:hypothetical protein